MKVVKSISSIYLFIYKQIVEYNKSLAWHNILLPDHAVLYSSINEQHEVQRAKCIKLQ